MANKRKYPKIKEGYWVYSIKVPSINKYYIGISKRQCRNRWQKAMYKNNSLAPYLDEWQDMEKTVLIDGLNTKEEALKYEDALIQILSRYDICINSNRSGLITKDMKQWSEDNPDYMKQYYQVNPEQHERQKQRCKQYRENNPDYMKQYYENNKEKIREQQRQNRLKKKLEQQQNHTSLPLS